MKPEIYLGLDSSTQGVTAVLWDAGRREAVRIASLNYGRDLPHYGCPKGVLPSADPAVAHAPPGMWAEGLDVLLARLRADGAPLESVRALAVSAQQHGSVYLNAHAAERLAGLRWDADLPLQISDILSRRTSPIWMDASTSEECAEIRRAMGGKRAVIEATGSNTFERFTGPQIRAFWKREPAAYASTAHIALVNSFLTSLLIGRLAPLEPGDAAGMNLMDIRARDWHEGALNATAPDLRRRLPAIVPSDTVAGPVAPWLTRRHGLARDVPAVVGTGDNPSSLVGLGLIEPEWMAVSLGTSDTCFRLLEECRTDARGEGHVFGAPTGGYFTLLCFQNGSLARERVRDRFGLDWDGFTEAIRSTPPGNNGRMMLPWFSPEIVPRVRHPRPFYRGLDPADAAAHCRAIVESQMLAMRVHAQWMGGPPRGIRVTGGASANPEIRRIMADVMGCPVYHAPVTNSAALGAAIRAAHAERRARGEPASWEELAAPPPGAKSPPPLEPDPVAHRVYERMAAEYAEWERQAWEEIEGAADDETP